MLVFILHYGVRYFAQSIYSVSLLKNSLQVYCLYAEITPRELVSDTFQVLFKLKLLCFLATVFRRQFC